MRFLFVSPLYYPHIGGVENVVKSIAERLVALGHEVVVLAGEPSANAPFEEVIGGVRVVRWPTWAPGLAYHVPRLRERLERWLRQAVADFDVVHVHNVHSIFSVWTGLRILGLGFRGRVILSTHYHGGGHTAFRNALWIVWRRYVERLLRESTVHAASSHEAKLLERDFGVESVVIEHGVDEGVAELTWRPGDYAMYSGRIEKYKNIEKLGEVIKRLNEEYGLGLRLEVYGYGSYTKALINRLGKLRIEYSVGGFLPREKYLEKLAEARFFASFSQREAFGVSVNEATAIGVPSVVVKPWGEIFRNRARVLVVDLSDGVDLIAKRVAEFLASVDGAPKPRVPSWGEVVAKYLLLLYA